MHSLNFRSLAFAALFALGTQGAASAQAPSPQPPPPPAAAPASQGPDIAAPATQGPAAPATVCNLPIPAPAALPPEGSEPVIYQIVPCFPQQGNVSNVEPETYL